MTNSITLHLTTKQEENLYSTYQQNVCTAIPYSKWQIKLPNCVITCYNSGKTLFQGNDCEKYASQFTTSNTTTTKISSSFPQAGSDEVGTGDYLGPVVVCAAYVSKENKPLLEKLGVKDSKALTDEQILKIGQTIIKTIPHSVLIVSDKKYNQVHLTTNLNAIKAKLHNQAYINLSKKVPLPPLCVVDQFAPSNLYYRYLQKEPQIIKSLHFETKAENKYLAVGTASIIARYTFLQYWKKMEEHYHMTFYKGAGEKVDACAIEFIKKYGKEEFANIAKLHFKNTEEIFKKI